MKLEESQLKKLKPLKSLVAFKFSQPKKTKGGIHLPETYYDANLRQGRYLIGKVIAVGEVVKDIKKNDYILVAEYSRESLGEELKDGDVYFIESKYIAAKVDNEQWVFKKDTIDADELDSDDENVEAGVENCSGSCNR